MLKTIIGLLATVLLYSSAAFSAETLTGTTGHLAGKIVDASTKEPLIGVNIILVDTKMGGTTDEYGKYKIFNIPVGKYSIRFSYIGYKKHTVENVTITADATTKLDIELQPGSLTLEEVVVTEERQLFKQDITGTVHTIESKQFELFPIDDFLQAAAMQPGVTRDLHIRGGRATEVQFLVDGLPFTEAAGGSVGGMLPKSSILEMKILTGGFDVEFGNATSGVINIITKRGSGKATFMIRGDIDHYFGTKETNKANYLEISASGPILKNDFTYFSAMDIKTEDTRWYRDFRTGDQRYEEKYNSHFNSPVRKEFNNITKFNLNFSENLRINAQIITSWNKEHDYEFRWRENLTGLPDREKLSNRMSIGISQFLAKDMFYNLSVSRYYVNSRLGPKSASDLDLTDLLEYDYDLQFVMSGSRLWWANDKQTQLTIKADLVKEYLIQKTSDRQSIKIGGEITFYDMNIKRIKIEPRKNIYGWPLINEEPLDYSTSYKYKPRAGAFFIQNKFRFIDGGTFSIGTRYDFFDPRSSRPNLEWVPTGTDDFERTISKWVPATIKDQVSQRLGISFPLSHKEFLFVNFGFFFQMPLFDYLYSGLDINLKKKNAVLIGNPDMKHQNTKSWEIGYRRKIRDDVSVTVTMFKKDTRNLIDTRTFLASDSKALDDGYYSQYVNSPNAFSRGLEITFEKFSSSLFYGRLSYTYMKAEGLSDRSDMEMNYIQWGFQPTQQLYPLSWDQRHTVSGVLSSNLPWDISINTILNYHSPRPYTYYPSRTGVVPEGTILVPNNRRMESNAWIDLKAVKQFKLPGAQLKLLDWKFYIDVRNLLDRQNILWIANDGTIGGELRDPGAYDIGRRTRIGVEINFR